MKKIFNWKQFNENFGHDGAEHIGGQDDTRSEWCDGCGELHQNCTCEHDDVDNVESEDDMRSEWCDGCGELHQDCMCGGEGFPTHDDSRFPYDNESDFDIHEKKSMPEGLKKYLDKKTGKKTDKTEKDNKGKTPTTKKEKELAAKYPPKDKITKGDFIAAAKEKAKKK